MGKRDDDEEEDEDEDEEVVSEDIKRRVNRIERRFQTFLEDIADDVLEPKTLEKIERKVAGKMRGVGSAPTLANLRLFAEAFEFGMSSTMKLGGSVAQLLIGIRKIVKDKESKTLRSKIDITKSKPLPENEKDDGGI